MAARTVLRFPTVTLRGSNRTFTRTSVTPNASQPAPSSSSTGPNPHAARIAAAAAAASSSSSSSASSDPRSRLAKLQAQRLEELNRGRSGPSSSSSRPNKPEQKWSNRTLIALATSVGACTYLMGTYHGYNAGKAHAVEEQQQLLVRPDSPVVVGQPAVGGGLVGGEAPRASQAPRAPAAMISASSTSATSSLSTALKHLLPINPWPIQCEPASKQCRLAELTQYHCDLQTDRVVCQPIDRIFRICKGRPAVEVSHIVEFDQFGNPFLPEHLEEAMPPSSHWHELRSPEV